MYKIFLILIVCFLSVLPPFATKNSHARGLGEIDSYLQEQVKRSLIPGLSYAIVHRGKIVHMNAFGVAAFNDRLMTPQTPLYIGSVAKTFTALAIRQLANAGKLDLNTPVINYLPYFTLEDAEATQQITIRQLLDHTSGFSEQDGNDPIFYQQNATNEALVRLLATFHLNRPVGESFEYSNLNYIILGQVIEAVSGLSYAEYIQQFVFNPLQMNHSFADEEQALQAGLSLGYRYFFGLPMAVDLYEPKGAIAAGFLMSNAEDMAHYLIAFTENGRYNGISVVNPDGLLHPDDIQLTYNIDWLDQTEFKRPSNTETHSGAWLNYTAGIAFMPADRIGVVVLANANPAQWLPVKDAFALTYDVLRLYTGNQPNPPTPTLVTLYLMVDAILLSILALIIFRFATLRGWKQHLKGKGLYIWLPSLFVDVLLPLFVLLFLPGLILASTGRTDPVWCWNRLAFQIPDITWAMLLMVWMLLLVGLVKIWVFVRSALYTHRTPSVETQTSFVK